MSTMGVFLYCSIALAAESLLRDPSRDVLLWMILLADFTPNSALPFDWGYPTDEI